MQTEALFWISWGLDWYLLVFYDSLHCNLSWPHPHGIWAFRQCCRPNLVRFISPFCQRQQLSTSVFWLKTMTVFCSPLHFSTAGGWVKQSLPSPLILDFHTLISCVPPCLSALYHLLSEPLFFFPIKMMGSKVQVRNNTEYNQWQWTHNQFPAKLPTSWSKLEQGFWTHALCSEKLLKRLKVGSELTLLHK